MLEGKLKNLVGFVWGLVPVGCGGFVVELGFCVCVCVGVFLWCGFFVVIGWLFEVFLVGGLFVLSFGWLVFFPQVLSDWHKLKCVKTVHFLFVNIRLF